MADAPVRIGLIIPANNTTMEAEVPRLAPVPVEVVTCRVKRGPGLLSAADIPSYKQNALAAISALRDARPDRVIYGCTAAGFLSGPEKDTSFTDELRDLFGVPVVSTARAMADMLHREGVKRVDVVSPYHDEVNEALRTFLARAEIEALRIASLEAKDVESLGRMTAQDVYGFAARALSPSAQGLFIACSQLPTFEILDALRHDHGVPVWSSIAAATELVFAAADTSR